jgi:cob(I)alamin adenosyltransferase
MSIATMRGDGGETGLAGGVRVRKDDPRVDTYGTIDELISSLGFARSICKDEALRTRTKEIQKELFKVGSAIATPPNSKKTPPVINDELVDALTADVHRIEAIEGVLADWSIPGEDTVSASYDVSRTICPQAASISRTTFCGT